MPFGLIKAPATLLRVVNTVLADLPFAKVNIDYVLLCFKSLGNPVEYVKLVFERMSKWSLKVKLSKCHFAHPKAHLLGHVVRGHGVLVDENKI